MRLLRIEDGTGRGYINHAEMFISNEPFQVWNKEVVACLFGGDFVVSAGTLTEIELVQLYLIYFNTSDKHYFFEMLFHGPKRWICNEGGMLTYYVFFTEFEFIEQLEKMGLLLYHANLPEKDVRLQEVERYSGTCYQVEVCASSWHLRKKIYKPALTDTKGLTEPVETFRDVFCDGTSAALKYLQTPSMFVVV